MEENNTCDCNNPCGHCLKCDNECISIVNINKNTNIECIEGSDNINFNNNDFVEIKLDDDIIESNNITKTIRKEYNSISLPNDFDMESSLYYWQVLYLTNMAIKYDWNDIPSDIRYSFEHPAVKKLISSVRFCLNLESKGVNTNYKEWFNVN